MNARKSLIPLLLVLMVASCDDDDGDGAPGSSGGQAGLSTGAAAGFPSTGTGEGGVANAPSGEGGTAPEGGGPGAGTAGEGGAAEGGGAAVEAGNAGSGGVPGEFASTSVEIDAMKGGEAVLGDLRLAIPANVLEDNATITIEATTPPEDFPELPSVQGLAYDLGPDGTTFAAPVTLTLPLPFRPFPGEAAVISWLDTVAWEWRDLETTLVGDFVRAEVNHFTTFVVRIVEAPADDCSFTACGGDIVGIWDIENGCVEASPDSLAGCPNAVVDVDTDVTGAFAFDPDGSFSVGFEATTQMSADVPSICVLEDCATLAEDIDGTCAPSSSGGCFCSAPLPKRVQDRSGTYSVSGNAVTVVEGSDPPDSHDFCVRGDILKLRVVNGDGSVTLFVARKR